MASLNASGVPVVPKQYVGLRSYGRNIVTTSGANPYGQRSVRSDTVLGVPPSERDAADFGDQSSPAIESFLRLGSLIKHTESVDDTTVDRILGTVPPDSGNQPEIALADEHRLREDHTGNRIVERDTLSDTITRRTSNESERPGGEI